MEQMKFLPACLKYFGKKEGQSNSDFMQEVRDLTPEDRAYFKALFPSVGIQIVDVT